MSDTRELRERLEHAQGEVKRLTRALDAARTLHSPKALEKEVARLAARVARHEAHRGAREKHWREREADWQARERSLRDELDRVRRAETVTSRALDRAEARLTRLRARVERLQAPSAASKLLEPLRLALTSADTEAELQMLRREVVRLRRQLSLQQPRLRR